MDVWSYPVWIAHRGAGKLAPENTLAAFRLGASYGFRAFECDVKLSADGVAFLLHDDTLDRTSSGQGPAGECSWNQLSRLDAGSWHSSTYAGEPIASLEAIAAYCLSNAFTLNIELKPMPGAEERTGRVVGQQVLRLWHGAPPLLSSFHPKALAGARVTARDLPRALLLDSLWPGCMEVAASLGCVALVTDHTLMDKGLIEQIHRAGQRALVYTVNDEERAQKLLALGIDGIITDAIDRFAPGGGHTRA
jgi:glycerophosphoryl diester phosphodiesterase